MAGHWRIAAIVRQRSSSVELCPLCLSVGARGPRYIRDPSPNLARGWRSLAEKEVALF